MTLQVTNRDSKITVTLPAQLVQRVVEMANDDDADTPVSDYIANVLREAVATHEAQLPREAVDQESGEIRARLKKLGYL